MSETKGLTKYIGKMAEMYSSSPELRALLQLKFPIVGSAADIMLTDWAQRAIERRFKELLKDLRRELALVRQRKLDKAYLRSEEFLDLWSKAINETIRTRHNEKIAYYAKIVRGAIESGYQRKHSAEDFLNVVADMNLNELLVCKAIFHQEQRMHLAKDLIKKLCPDLAEEDIEFTLLRLQRHGLLHEMILPVLGYAGGSYKTTETFTEMMTFLMGKGSCGGQEDGLTAAD